MIPKSFSLGRGEPYHYWEIFTNVALTYMYATNIMYINMYMYRSQCICSNVYSFAIDYRATYVVSIIYGFADLDQPPLP